MNNNGLISRQTAIDKLFEYAESKFQSGEIELANGILKAKCFLDSPCNIPTAYDVDKVIKGLERLKETEQNREDECDEEGYGDAEQIFLDGESQGKFKAYIKAIEVVKAGGINNNVSKKM